MKNNISIAFLLLLGICCHQHNGWNFALSSLEIESSLTPSKVASSSKNNNEHTRDHKHHRSLRSANPLTPFFTESITSGCALMESEGDCTEMEDCMWCDIKLNSGPNHRQYCFHHLSVNNDDFQKSLLKCKFKNGNIEHTMWKDPNANYDVEEQGHEEDEHHKISAHTKGPDCENIQDMKGCTQTKECMWCELSHKNEEDDIQIFSSYACKEYKPDDFEWETNWKKDASIVECALPAV